MWACSASTSSEQCKFLVAFDVNAGLLNRSPSARVAFGSQFTDPSFVRAFEAKVNADRSGSHHDALTTIVLFDLASCFALGFGRHCHQFTARLLAPLLAAALVDPVNFVRNEGDFEEEPR